MSAWQLGALVFLALALLGSVLLAEVERRWGW